MVIQRIKLIFIFIVIQLINGQHIPSQERGNVNYRRDTDIDVNKVRATVHNWGYTGKTGDFIGYGYEWPVNSGN